MALLAVSVVESPAQIVRLLDVDIGTPAVTANETFTVSVQPVEGLKTVTRKLYVVATPGGKVAVTTEESAFEPVISE